MIRAVVFDLDGTLTEPFFDFDAIREEIGMRRDGGPILEAMESMSPAQRARANKILAQHEARAVAESRLNPGARRTLDALRAAAICIGVLTRNTRVNAWAVARKHELSFDAIVDRADGPVKPDPFGVLCLCKAFRVDPAETLVVGDYLFDLLSARAAGAKAVLLCHDERNERFAPQADFVIRQLDEVLEIIENVRRHDAKENTHA
jgi:HAD superfamily hydrolase (TIGR01509 family)